MSVARGFGLNGKSIYMNIAKPCLVEASFIVDQANVNGLGLKSLKSNGYIENIFMNSTASFVGDTHTSVLVDGIASTANLVVGMHVQGSGIPAGATIASIVSATSINLSAATSTSVPGGTITYQGFNNGFASPGPLAGLILIQFKNNFNYFLHDYSSYISPLTGSDLAVTSGLTLGQAYTISVIGTTTAAEWSSIGLPAGFTPTVGQSFIATATGTGGAHTGKVQLAMASGVQKIEIVGSPNQLMANSNIASNAGAQLVGQFMNPGIITLSGSTHTSTTVDTLTPSNPILAGVRAGMSIMGTGIPLGDIVASVSSSAITLTAAATATAAGVALAVGPANIVTQPVDGSTIQLSFWFDGSSVTVDGL